MPGSTFTTSQLADHARIAAVVRESFDLHHRTASEQLATETAMQPVHAEPDLDFYNAAADTHRERVDADTYRAQLRQQHAEMHARYTNVDATIERLVALRILEKLARAATFALVGLGTYAAGMQAKRWIDVGIETPAVVGLVLSIASLVAVAIVANVAISKGAKWARAKATA